MHVHTANHSFLACVSQFSFPGPLMRNPSIPLIFLIFREINIASGDENLYLGLNLVFLEYFSAHLLTRTNNLSVATFIYIYTGQLWHSKFLSKGEKGYEKVCTLKR